MRVGSAQLERKRYVDQLNAEKYRKEEELRKQEEYLAKQEAIKRKTLEYEAELRQQTELARWVGSEGALSVCRLSTPVKHEASGGSGFSQRSPIDRLV
jgi:hypothetical protein